MAAHASHDKVHLPSTLDCITADQFRAELAARNGSNPPQSSASEPVPINQSQGSKHIAKVYDLCQKHALPYPVFDYTDRGIRRGAPFAARLSLSLPKSLARLLAAVVPPLDENEQSRVALISEREKSVLVVEDEVFVTKKAGKEAVAARTWPLLIHALESANAAGMPISTVAMNGEATKTKESYYYISRLLEWTQATPSSELKYDFFALDKCFSCTLALTLTLPLSLPLLLPPSSNGTKQSQSVTFGSTTRAFASKKAAKAAAAKEAVQWLRERGFVDESGVIVKRKKHPQPQTISSGTSTPTPIPISNNGSPGTQDGLSSRKAGSDTPASASASVRAGSPGDPSTYARRVVLLRDRLGLSNFEYRLVADSPGGSSHSGAAYFPDEVDPRFSGPLGAVSGVRGRKHAKEEIARGACAVLEEVLRARGRAAGINGGGGGERGGGGGGGGGSGTVSPA